eukprot:3600262-Prymnesium_polylepis.1
MGWTQATHRLWAKCRWHVGCRSSGRPARIWTRWCGVLASSTWNRTRGNQGQRAGCISQRG